MMKNYFINHREIILKLYWVAIFASQKIWLGSARLRLASCSEPSRAVPSPSQTTSHELFFQP